MKNITLVVLAAGMGSRFGGRIKQLEPIGPNGELLIEYSIRDAIEAGFSKVVFIIRRDIEQIFKDTIGDRISQIIPTEYVFQDRDMLPVRTNDFSNRTKPWGTAQALYCCKNVLSENFGVINADDFYGKKAFVSLAGFLQDPDASACSVGFILKNTLSDNGTVNRGICHINEAGLLVNVEETKKIEKSINGVIRGIRNDNEVILNENDTVSMSMWGFKPSFVNRLSDRLSSFITALSPNELTAEMTIAEVVDAEIKQNGYDVRNIFTDSRWYGITYEADVEFVREVLRN
ncbi:MAG: NTP transferase domain-containing protein [Oscillospiraceae bacterium]|nr:NTP transferase domain-containing protein [Oscillospiraceae bacterium]